MIEITCPICPPETRSVVRFHERLPKKDLAFVARKTPERAHFQINQCTGCGLIFASPILPLEEIHALYSESAYIDEPQVANMAHDYEQELKKILPLCREKQRALEIGASSGFFLKKLSDLGFQEVWGIEPSREAAALAAKDFAGRVINDILKPGQFEDNSFDMIVFFQVFDHITTPNEFLELCYRYLKPGGVLFAIHHNIRAPMPVILGEKASTYDMSHIHLWDHRTMRLILEKYAFTDIAIKNIKNRYEILHIIRMLPLPSMLRNMALSVAHLLRLNGKSLRVHVENMSVYAKKPIN